MLRVLQAVTCMDRGGLETMLMNYYRHIDRTRVQFRFLTSPRTGSAYDKEIYSLGGKFSPCRGKTRSALHTAMHCTNFFSAHPAYTVVHAHLDCLSGVVSVAPSSTACLYALLTHTPQIRCATQVSNKRSV